MQGLDRGDLCSVGPIPTCAHPDSTSIIMYRRVLWPLLQFLWSRVAVDTVQHGYLVSIGPKIIIKTRQTCSLTNHQWQVTLGPRNHTLLDLRLKVELRVEKGRG